MWVEVPDGWGWGPVQLLKTTLTGGGYHVEEHRVTASGGGVRVVLALTGSPARTSTMAVPPPR